MRRILLAALLVATLLACGGEDETGTETVTVTATPTATETPAAKPEETPAAREPEAVDLPTTIALTRSG